MFWQALVSRKPGKNVLRLTLEKAQLEDENAIRNSSRVNGIDKIC